MKFSLQPDTLAFQLSRPGTSLRDASACSTQAVAAQTKVFLDSPSVGAYLSTKDSQPVCGDPQADAVTFYMMNHAMSVVRAKVHPLQPLGAYLPVVEAYYEQLAVLSARMFFYLLLICTRESRHCKTDPSSSKQKSWAAKYGVIPVTYVQALRGKGSLDAANYFMGNPPKCSLGVYCRFLADVFNEGDFSSAFGGKAWGKIAELLRDFVLGKLTAEMMLDTAFTLAHNTAPIFNKGMLFDSWTQELYTILDVQRSGQIPKYVAEKQCGGLKVIGLYKLCAQVMPEEFSGYVDYFLVEELGSKKSYTTEKQQQVAKHGYPSKFKAKLAVEALKKDQAAKQAAAEEAQYVTLYPGCKVKIAEYEREE